MIYLIASIFLYLLIALAMGAVAGWLWRDLQASREAAAVRRTVIESRARLPEMEEAVRARDDRFEAVRQEYNEREDELAGARASLAERDQTITELEQTCAELRARLESTPAPADAPPRGDGALEQLERALTSEQRRVEELTRERELQKRSLAALEQQLELARDGKSRMASG